MDKPKLKPMPEAKAKRRAIKLKDKWAQIVTDAFRFGYLTDDNCAGCGKYQCGGCPCGTSTGWRDLKV